MRITVPQHKEPSTLTGECPVLRDMDYIQRRARQERDAAKAATSDRSRRIHEELAGRYEEILRAYRIGAFGAA